MDRQHGMMPLGRGPTGPTRFWLFRSYDDERPRVFETARAMLAWCRRNGRHPGDGIRGPDGRAYFLGWYG